MATAISHPLVAIVLLAVAVSACAAVAPPQGPSPSATALAGSSPSASAVPSEGSSPSGGVTAAPSPTQTSVDATPSAIAGPCQSDVNMGVLPTWARTGFSEPEPAMPHLLTRSGDVAAILFGFPLASPPRDGVTNKILWVHREGPTSPVEISAQLMDGTAAVGEPVARRLNEGFAPSIVDLPAPGCWRLTLTYGDRTDSIDLEYGPTPAG